MQPFESSPFLESIGYPFGILAALLFIGLTFVIGRLYLSSGASDIAEHPDCEVGYRKVYRAWCGFGYWVWGWMLVAVLIGRKWPDQFVPYDPTPANLIFHGAVYSTWIGSTWWVLFAGGAELIVSHPGKWLAPIRQILKPIHVKVAYCMMLATGVCSLFAGLLSELSLFDFVQDLGG